MALFTVHIRRDQGKPIRPEAEQLDGNSYTFERGWTMDENDPYPGEVAWIPRDPAYPSDAPLWIASGDLRQCSSVGDGILHPCIAISNDELGEELQDFIICPHCNEQHEVQCSSTNPANRNNFTTLQFYKCGDKTYLAGINRKKYFPK